MKTSYWNLRTDSVWVAVILTVVMLWGTLMSVNRLKRRIAIDQEELAEFQRSEADSLSEQIASLTIRLESLEELLATVSEPRLPVTAERVEGQLSSLDDSRVGEIGEVDVGGGLESDQPFSNAVNRVKRMQVVKQEEFVASLDAAGRSELDERTMALVDSWIEKSVEDNPEGLGTRVLSELESKRELILERVRPVVVQQMLLERQRGAAIDLPVTQGEP